MGGLSKNHLSDEDVKAKCVYASQNKLLMQYNKKCYTPAEFFEISKALFLQEADISYQQPREILLQSRKIVAGLIDRQTQFENKIIDYLCPKAK